MSKFLHLRLSGPFQSWGCDSLYWNRETGDFPSKSGVIGLLFCAMGKGGAQREALAEIAPLRQKVFQVARLGHRSSILNDLQIVGGGYDENDPWQLACIPKTHEGKKARTGGVKMTQCYYLQECHFVVIQEIPEAWKDAVVQGLISPIWDIYLGRKCCVPSLPVLGGIYDTQEAAESAFREEMSSVYGDGYHPIAFWEEVSAGAQDCIRLRDVPLVFGKNKQYAYRHVVRHSMV